MKFFTILAIVFYGGGTVSVSADYYIEFQAPAAQASSSMAQTSTTMTIYLYGCKGAPAGTAIQAPRSLCTPVTSPQRKHFIYSTCTFYDVHRANLQGHVIHLSDRGVMPNIPWMLGYSNHAIDHPDFADPSQEDIWYFTARTVQLGVHTVIPPYLVGGIASYFAQTNLIALSANTVSANLAFLNFATLLRRITEKYSDIYQENNPVTLIVRLKARLDYAAKVCLHKMMDPCSVLFGNHQTFASQYCATYWNFLSIAAARFGTGVSSCSSLEGGQCVGVVCTCIRVMSSPFAGCSTTPMLQFHNTLRTNLNQLTV